MPLLCQTGKKKGKTCGMKRQKKIKDDTMWQKKCELDRRTQIVFAFPNNCKQQDSLSFLPNQSSCRKYVYCSFVLFGFASSFIWSRIVFVLPLASGVSNLYPQERESSRALRTQGNHRESEFRRRRRWGEQKRVAELKVKRVSDVFRAFNLECYRSREVAAHRVVLSAG